MPLLEFSSSIAYHFVFYHPGFNKNPNKVSGRADTSTLFGVWDSVLQSDNRAGIDTSGSVMDRLEVRG